MSESLLISEVLQKVHNAKTKAEKVELLRKYNSQALRSILIWNYDDSVVSIIPEGEVPYTKNEAPEGTEHTRLEREYRILYNFVKGGNDNLPRAQRENMFIQLIEGLHESEAEVVCLTKDKALQSKYRITKPVVQEAFPEIQWGGRS
jgi:Family of unknown function (DUF6433)